MPAIDVARTDTFEVQRQKINQIGDQIFTITEGGSDLATGNLKLGDGTRTTPSLAFSSDASLGIYKPSENTFGFVSSGKKVADFSPSALYSFRDFIVQRNLLVDSGISILNNGINYDTGNYNSIPIIGGTGEGATADITVTEYIGSYQGGLNYNEGSYQSISLVGGSGSGATVNFSVEGIDGTITNAGNGYVPGTYENISLTGGSGSAATADIIIDGETIISGNITNSGSGYTENIYQSVTLLNIPTQTFILTSTSNGTPPPDNVYQIDGNTQLELNLIRGNTYRFDISDTSVSQHPLLFQTLDSNPVSNDYYTVVQKGSNGVSGSFIDLIINVSAPLETIKYVCSVHEGMGANINIIDGLTGQYGYFAEATITVNSSNVVSNVEITRSGINYKNNDILEIYSDDVGGIGSGFQFTLNAPVYTGIISNVSILNNGLSYVKDDILSANISDIGGEGSGFQYTITSDPGIIQNLVFIDKGNNYQTADILTLPQAVTNVSTTLNGAIVNVSTTLSDSSASITVSDTTGIVEGMQVSGSFEDVGQLAPSTTVLSVDSSTTLTLSQIPSTSGSATLSFNSSNPPLEIEVSSTTGIQIGFLIEKVSGTGVLANSTTVSSINSENNIITLSNSPEFPGDIVINFVPPYGNPVNNFQYTISQLGVIETFDISSGGNGYSVSDILTINPTDLTQSIVYQVYNKQLQEITFVSSLPENTFSVGDFIVVKDSSINEFSQTDTPQIQQTIIDNISTTLSDSSASITVSDTTGILEGMIVNQSFGDVGQLAPGTTVLSVDSSTTLTLSQIPSTSGSAILSFESDETGSYLSISSTSDGNGIGATFDIERSINGSIVSVVLNSSGYYYSQGEILTILGTDVGGVSPDHDITIEVISVEENVPGQIISLTTDSGNITSLYVEDRNFQSTDIVVSYPVNKQSPDENELDTTSNSFFRFFIDLNDGSGQQLSPSFTLYSGNTYTFDYSDSSNSGHIFSLSKFRDGIWSPSVIENINTVLDTNSNEITVTDSSGILSGMAVNVISGNGQLLGNTFVESINGNIITLTQSPLESGNAVLSFSGVEYTEGVTRSDNSLTIKIFDSTPNLYYYCSNPDISHQNEGGNDNEESLITISLDNPKVFGSNFSASVLSLDTNDVVSCDIETGTITSTKYVGGEIESTTAVISTSLTSPSIFSNNVTASIIQSSQNLQVNSPTTSFSGNVNIGSTVQILSASGNITTSGVLKTTNSVNINDRITITNNNISSTSGNNILLSPAVGRVAKINTTSALTIPSGTTAQRPTTGIVENGSIRFNTETGQYEGYSAATSSWSSLGGVRDLDGNTYIAAEASIGANDNTLYFFNDGNNTVSVTPSYLQFVDVKKIRSVNTTAPAYTDYTTNTQVTLGQYLKYQNNIYEVTVAGQTGTSGNEPIHTTGAATNGTAELTWYTTAIAPLTFEEISEVRIDPLGFTDLVVNAELRFSTNVISTDLNDLIIQPNSGKKVSIDAETSLVIPVGDNNQRGVAEQGSIRYNTDISQYEGYDGSNWTSLGGVKDVDGNTYIIPETAPGANENILYFYNDGINTMRLSANALDFTNIDAITSQNNNLDIEAQTVTFNSLSATIDTSGTSTFISTTKDNLDLGLAVGLNVDPLLRLDINGDIYLNKAFGTGSFDGLKLFNSDLSTFELADLAISTSDIGLIKGGTNAGAATLYDPATQSGARVSVSVVNQTTGDKEMIEYQVIDKGSDIYHTEIGNLKTGANQVTSVFDFDANNNVRVTFTLDDNLTVGDVVNITVVKNIFKN